MDEYKMPETEQQLLLKKFNDVLKSLVRLNKYLSSVNVDTQTKNDILPIFGNLLNELQSIIYLFFKNDLDDLEQYIRYHGEPFPINHDKLREDLKAVMYDKGFQQKQLANETGLNIGTLGNLLREKPVKTISAHTLRKVAKYLKTDWRLYVIPKQ